MVISYVLDDDVKNQWENLSPKMRSTYERARDYMKMGKWFMFRVSHEDDLRDYQILMSVKIKPKTSKPAIERLEQ